MRFSPLPCCSCYGRARGLGPPRCRFSSGWRRSGCAMRVGNRCLSAGPATDLGQDERRESGRVASARGAPASWRSGGARDGFLVRAGVVIVHALGLDGVKVVGSTRRACLKGWIAEESCVGARKAQMLKEAGIVPPWSVVYTDSASNLPLLHLAKRRCVVNATPAALRTLNRELGPETLEIVQWK